MLALTAWLFAMPAVAQGEAQFFRIGTGAVDSPSFAVAGIVAAGLSSPPGGRTCDHGGSCGVPGMIALAQAIDSCSEALDLLAHHQLDAVIVPADEAYRAYAAKPTDGKKRDQLRTVGTLFVEAVHVVVRAGSRFETVADLKSRPVAVATDDPSVVPFTQLYAGRVSFGGRRQATVTLLQAGLQRLADSRLDGLLIVTGAPSTELVDFAQLTPIRLLDAPPLPSGSYPFLTQIKLPVGGYPGVEPIDLPALPTQLLVAAAADPDRIEAITRALWNEASQKLLAAGPAVARSVKLERALAGIAVPLHPGAARFYRDAGLLANAPVGE